MSDLIERLKKNRLPVCKMAIELREKMAAIKGNQFQILQTTSTPDEDRWGGVVRGKGLSDNSTNVYRLRDTYTESSGFAKCQIVPVVDGPSMFCDSNLNPLGELSSAIDNPDFIGFEATGFLFGCLYRTKGTGLVETIIKVDDLDLYDVLTPNNVLFKKAEV